MPDNSETTSPDQALSSRERIRKFGKEAFVNEEMLRLGFWPPDEITAHHRLEALAEIAQHREELIKQRQALGVVEKKISAASDVTKILEVIRKRRIERVRLQREQKRLEKAERQVAHTVADQARRHATPPFLGHEVSAGLRFEGGNLERLQTLGLPALENTTEIAAAIGIDERTLLWLTYHRGTSTIDHYHRFTIPKRTGGTRVISSPKSKLRVAQSWLQQNILSKIELHEAATAFRPGASILHNAMPHLHQAIVIRLDLKDFFPSIGFWRVKGLFHSFGYSEGVATILALLATEAPRVAVKLDGAAIRYVAVGQRQLPQGACTSPAITNILCRHMDKRLSGLAKASGYIYTRYADDCVFSTEQSQPPIGLGKFLHRVRQVITDEGFEVKEEKTMVMRPQQRQTVTGLVVNEAAPHISRHDLRNFRAFLHHCETEGLPAMSEKLGKSALSYARGYLAFIEMVSPDKAAQLLQKHTWLARPN